LPPSNAVHPHPIPGDTPVPPGYHPARRGKTTFFFKFRTPVSSPSSVSFANGLAKIRYEVRASVGVAFRGEKRLVTNNIEAEVVQCQDMDGAVEEHVAISENGKFYIRGLLLGGRIFAGEVARFELQVKNHTSKKVSNFLFSLPGSRIHRMLSRLQGLPFL